MARGCYCKGKRKGTVPYKCHFGVLFTSYYHPRKRALICLPQKGLNGLAWHPGKGCLGERYIAIYRVFWITAKDWNWRKQLTMWIWLLFELSHNFICCFTLDDKLIIEKKMSSISSSLNTPSLFLKNSRSQTKEHHFTVGSTVFFSRCLVIGFPWGVFPEFQCISCCPFGQIIWTFCLSSPDMHGSVQSNQAVWTRFTTCWWFHGITPLSSGSFYVVV